MSDPYQELSAAAGSDAAASLREPSPASDQAEAAPVSKMRRRWRLSSTRAAQPALLPMEESPGSSGAASFWQLVVPPPAPRFDVESISDGDEIFPPSVCYDSTVREPALSAMSLFQPAPKPKAWQRPTVCLRFSSPFQVDQPEPKPLARPTGSCRRFRPQAQWTPQPPLQRERASWGSDAAPMPSFSNAHVYAKYPSQQASCPIDSTLRCPTPAPSPPRVEPPGVRPPRQSLSRPPANWSRRQVFPARWMRMLKCRGETTYSLSSFATCTSSSALSCGRSPLAATVMFFGVSFWPRLAIPQRLDTSDPYRSSSPPLRNLVGTFATWRQASCLTHSSRFQDVLKKDHFRTL